MFIYIYIYIYVYYELGATRTSTDSKEGLQNILEFGRIDEFQTALLLLLVYNLTVNY